MITLQTQFWRLVVCVALLAWAGAASAQEVFRSVDENGVVSFSDKASSGAQRLVLPGSPAPDEAALSAQQSIIDQQLQVARALEESRLAREAARTRRLEALAAAEPQTVYYPVPQVTRGFVSYAGWERKHEWGGKDRWSRKDGYGGGRPGGGLYPQPPIHYPNPTPPRPQHPGGRLGGRSAALLAPP